MNFPILSFLTFFPLIGVIFILLRRGSDEVIERSSKNISILVSVINFIVSLFLWSKFDPANAGFQFIEETQWIKNFVSYKMGVDGISIFLVLLTTFISPLCIFAAINSLKKRIKEFLIAILIMQTFMIGVFCALDLFLFFLFFEGGLIPMFLIIGIWDANLKVAQGNLAVAQGGLGLRREEFNRGGYQLKEGPEGLSYVPTAPGGPAIPVMTAAGTPFEGAGAKPTEDQSKSAGFAFRMKQSSQIFNQPALNRSGEPIIDPKTGNPVTLEQAFGQPGKYQSIMRSIPSAGLTTGLANLSESTGSQQYRQAQQNWVTANLRPESGAVIGADEMDKEIIKYFPQTSDSQKTIEQKARARRDTELAMTVRAGPAYKQMEKAVAAQNAALTAPAPMAQPSTAVPTVRQSTGNARLVRDPVTGIFNYVME